MIQTNRILVGHDFTPYSDAALLEAARIARRLEAALYVVYVEVLHGDLSGLDANAADRTERLRQDLMARFAGIDGERGGIFSGVDVSFEILRDVTAGPALLAYADEKDIDLIVIGSHGRRGLQRMLMGSVAEEVVRKAPCPVLTMRGELENAPEMTGRTIVAPVDFSEHSLHALQSAKELAQRLGTKLVVVHVLEEQLHPAFYNMGMFSQYEHVPDIEQRAQTEMHAFVARAGGPDVPYEVQVRRGHAVRQITRAASELAPSMVVMASHGLTGLERFLMGSVTERVVRQSEHPVLTVKAFGKRLIAEASTS